MFPASTKHEKTFCRIEYGKETTLHLIQTYHPLTNRTTKHKTKELTTEWHNVSMIERRETKRNKIITKTCSICRCLYHLLLTKRSEASSSLLKACCSISTKPPSISVRCHSCYVLYLYLIV